MMEQFGIVNFSAFIFAGILLNLTPGPDTLYIVARSLASGKKAGIISALGISTGAVFHTLMAACGLSVIIRHSATAFFLLQYAGVCYLVYLGIKALTTQSLFAVHGEKKNTMFNYRGIYVSGMMTNILNPKVALFFLAFLPQFVTPGYQYPMISFFLLGATFITTGTIWCLFLAVFASLLTRKMLQKKWYANLFHKLTGAVFIGLGVKLALSGR